MTIRPEELAHAAGAEQPGQGWRAGREQRDRARHAATESRLRRRRQALADACRGLADGAPAAVRRDAAAILSGLGWTLPEIGAALGGPVPEADPGAGDGEPAVPGRDPVRQLRGLSRRAGLARRELDAVRGRLRPGGPDGGPGQEDEDVLLALGFSAAEVAEGTGAPGGALRGDAGGFPAGLPSAATLVRLVREDGPGTLDGYAPAIDRPVSRRVAAAWIGIIPAGITGRLSRSRADGSPQWPAPGPDGLWTLRALVLHRASGPNPGPASGSRRPRGQALMDRIRAVLADCPVPPSTPELRGLLGLTGAEQPALENALGHLVRRGLVTKARRTDDPRRAYWHLPGAPAADGT